MKLRQLQFAQAIAESRSFSQAAVLCHATQPTLSNAISQLEKELGGKLFTRTTRKVDLTPFGTYLLPYLQTVLDGRAEMQKAAEAFHNPAHKLLRIGFSPLVDMKLLDRILVPYRQRYPDVSIFFKECLLDDLSQRLSNNVVDIAIVPQNLQDAPCERFVFYSDELFYLSKDIGQSPSVVSSSRISSLPDDPIILTGGGCGLNGSLKALFEQQGAILQTYPGQAVSYQAIEEWTELGIGAGILPKAKLLISNERSIPLHMNDGRRAVFTFEWIWNCTVSSKSHIADFVDYVRTTVPILIGGAAECRLPARRDTG